MLFLKSTNEKREKKIAIILPFKILLLISQFLLSLYLFGCSSVVLEHKTFHRYTVRAKRGTVQSSRDSHQGGHKPRSAGASLRRYNEAALEQVSIAIIYNQAFMA